MIISEELPQRTRYSFNLWWIGASTKCRLGNEKWRIPSNQQYRLSQDHAVANKRVFRNSLELLEVSGIAQHQCGSFSLDVGLWYISCACINHKPLAIVSIGGHCVEVQAVQQQYFIFYILYSTPSIVVKRALHSIGYRLRWYLYPFTLNDNASHQDCSNTTLCLAIVSS